MAIVTKTLRPSGGDYTSIVTWEATEQTDLVSAGDSHVLECYKGDYTPHGGGLNYIRENLTINGWTTSASNTITIIAPESEAHDGTLKGGGADFTGFAHVHDTYNGRCVVFYEDYVHFKNIIYQNQRPDRAGGIYGNKIGIVCEKLIVDGAKGSAFGFYGLDIRTNSVTVINTLLSNCESGARLNYRGTAVVYNCNAVDCDAGFEFNDNNANAIFHIKNCLAYNCPDGGFIQNGTAGQFNVDYCASDDTTANTWGGTGNRINQTFTFADAPGGDYHLDVADAGAQDFGTDLSADPLYAFNDDIDFETRIAPWDIGFDEIAEGPPPAIEGTGALQAQSATVVGAGVVIPVITGIGALQAGSAAVVGAGETIGIATGTGALQAQDAAVSGVGDVISPDVGTGTLQAQSAQVSGVGAVVHAGSGALQAQSAAVVGVGEVGNVRTGAGALQAGEAAVVGTGIRVSVGSGALQAQDAAVSGAGVVEGLVSGTGALQAQSATVAGTGHLIRVGSGALQAQAAQIAGVGAILGELTLSPADIAAIADAVYAKLVNEGVVTQINEIWQRRGLDPANPQTYDKAGNEIRVGDITIDLSGDPSSVTQTRQP